MRSQQTTMSKDLSITIPLRKKDFDLAKKLSQKHEYSQKQQQVYFNTLARCAVNSYCQYLEIETNFDDLLPKKDSKDYFSDYLIDVADLTLKDWGKVECRPVLPNSETCYIPPEVFADRIGYFITEIDEENREAKILDFLPKVAESEIKIRQLEKNTEIFFEVLNLLDILKKETQQIQETKFLVTNSLSKIHKAINNLTLELKNVFGEKIPDIIANCVDSLVTNWFNNIFTGKWQYSVPITKNVASRDITETLSISSAKIINLGEQELTLSMSQKLLDNEEFELIVRLYPSNDYIYLPDGIKLAILDENDQSIADLEREANAKNWLQLTFAGAIDDQFSISVSLDDDNFCERFII